MAPHSILFAGLIGAAILATSSCGKVDARGGKYSGMGTCQDKDSRYHFRVFIPPWKYRKEYRCVDGDFRNCNSWSATGRYVFVVSDAPFVNFDSEIISTLTADPIAGTLEGVAQARIAEIQADAHATLIQQRDGSPTREMKTIDDWRVLDVYWRQEREFEGKTYRWYRRDSYIETSTGLVYHMEFFSLFDLALPEFDALVQSFRLGAAPDGAPRCQCRDEHGGQNTSCL